MTSNTETPVALVGITGPAFISDWFESWWLAMPNKGTPVIGTALLIGAATIKADGCYRSSYLHLESGVRDFAQLAVARMVREDDRVLAIGMEKSARAREVGATVVIPRERSDDRDNPALVLANRSQMQRLPWLFDSVGPDSCGVIAGGGSSPAVNEIAAEWQSGGEDTATIVERLAKQESGYGGLQSLSMWAYKGGYEWGSLVVGCPGANSKGIRALLANTARESGVPLYACGDALDLLIDETDAAGKGPQPIPKHWTQLE